MAFAQALSNILGVLVLNSFLKITRLQMYYFLSNVLHNILDQEQNDGYWDSSKNLVLKTLSSLKSVSNLLYSECRPIIQTSFIFIASSKVLEHISKIFPPHEPSYNTEEPFLNQVLVHTTKGIISHYIKTVATTSSILLVIHRDKVKEVLSDTIKQLKNSIYEIELTVQMLEDKLFQDAGFDSELEGASILGNQTDQGIDQNN